MSQEYQHLLLETSPSGVRTIKLNRPERLNAVNDRLSHEIHAAINEASADDAVRVIVITGAGRGFCAGLDLDPMAIAEHMAAESATRHARLDELSWVGRQALALAHSDKPVVAAINGPAAGAGFGLALGADIRLLKAGTVMTAGYIRRGLSPDAGVSYFLPRLVGASRAADIILTGRDISAEEAERIGLVSRVIEADNWDSEVAAYAETLAGGPPVAQTFSKRLLAASLDTDLESQLKQELAYIQRCFTTADVQEAMRAFGEKRRPNFKGV